MELKKGGIYRHFKGNLYQVLFEATHSETMEEMVVYQALYGERGIWVRSKNMFMEKIERDGTWVQRFMLTEMEKEDLE